MSATQAALRGGKYPSLAEIKRESLKSADAWWVVLVADPIAIRLLWLLVRVWPGLTPNAVTLASLMAGLAAGVAFFTGHLVWGALLYQLSFILDCVDGKLARLKGQTSPLGAFWDGLAGGLVYVTCVLCLVYRPNADPMLPPLGGVLLALWALHITVGYHLPEVVSGHWVRFAPRGDSWLRRHRLLYPMTFPDKHAVLFTLAPVAGFVLAGLAITVALEALLLAAKVSKVLRGGLEESQRASEQGG